MEAIRIHKKAAYYKFHAMNETEMADYINLPCRSPKEVANQAYDMEVAATAKAERTLGDEADMDGQLSTSSR
ncbi:hypothetical protein QFC24_004105 [Naganishia onofrii]|uniref:Uncharacterized protein n=1 Tax=Naganishia onofrii TaxID=1851511 RepID=A0ACC2XGB1_9TREE|nr:hypothetical protein QFC24_004105 [Naganishia onofrii]